MRDVEIGGEIIHVRGLKRRELREKLEKYGYGAVVYMPKKDAQGNTDLQLMNEANDIVLSMVVDAETIERIDEAAGNAGLNKIVRAAIMETYPQGNEEKNLSSTGSGSPPQSE